MNCSDEEWYRLVLSSWRLGIRRLLNELAIIRFRAHASWRQFTEQPSWENQDQLEFDLETLLTVAADLLKLAALILPTASARALESDDAYKRFRALRSTLARHRFDKPNGDPFGGLAHSVEDGPMLGAPSPIARRYRDPGLLRNEADIDRLINQHHIDLLWQHPTAVRDALALSALINAAHNV